MEHTQNIEQAKKARKRSPKHPGIVRAFRFAMDVRNPRPLFSACDTLCDWRNHLVDLMAERRRENRKRGEAGEELLSWLKQADLYKLVKTARAEKEKLGKLHTHLAQNVCVRVIEGTKRWLESFAEGDKSKRPPRRKDKNKYRSFTFPEYGNGCRIQNGRVFLSGFGWFKLHDHRKLRGRPKTITIKFAEGRWWCVVTTLIQEQDWFGKMPEDDQRPLAGGDPGLTSLLTDSHGRVYDPPRSLKDQFGKLRKEQRVMARKFRVREAEHEKAKAVAVAEGKTLPPLRETPYSNRLRGQIRRVAKCHTKAGRVRDHHHKKIASVQRSLYSLFAVEDHGLQFMIRNRKLAKSASDRAIGGLKHCLSSAFGSDLTNVPNHRAGIGGNSQTCVCGAAVPKELSDRIHCCEACGLTAPRDVVSANIAQVIAYGTVTDHLKSFVPAGGQLVVKRGEIEAEPGESRPARRRKSPSEISIRSTDGRREKRKASHSPRTKQGNTAGGKPTAEEQRLATPRAGKTPWNPKRIRPPRLPGEPQPRTSA